MISMNLLLALVVIAVLASGVCATAGDVSESDSFFPIMPWDGARGWSSQIDGFKHPLESVAECNFTVSGFVGPADLPVCERLGLKAVMIHDREAEPWKSKWVGVSDEAIDATVKHWVEESGKSSAVWGYYVTDEPGTPKFPALGKAVAALAKYAPGKLAYINLFPGYATIGAPDKSQLGAASFTEYLEKFVAEVKPRVLSYDNYKIMTSDNLQNRDQGASYFRDLLEVRRVSQEHGLPFWNVVNSNRIRPYTTVPSPANLLFQAYTTLAAGARGIAWYTYYDRGYGYAPISKSGRRSDTWFYLQMVNRQVKVLGPILNKLASTGVFFTDPLPVDGLPKLPGGLVERVDSKSSIKGFSDSTPPLMIGEYAGKDGDYVMIVNLSLEKSANITLHTLKTYAAKEVISAQDGSFAPIDEENGHWLVPGQGVLIRLVTEGSTK